MRWPWQRATEDRASSYTDAITEYLLSAAGAKTESRAVAAVELAAGLWSRAFASADVEPDTIATRALTPYVLAAIGRRLVTMGEAVFELRVELDRLRLVEASTWTITGGPDPETWAYELNIPGPSASALRTLPAQAVAHVMYERDRNEPWRGLSPLHGSQVSVSLLARVETRLREEAGTPGGYLLPMPDPKSSSKLVKDIQALSGGLVGVESMTDGWDQGRQAGTSSRDQWQPRRLGFNPPEVAVVLRDSTAREVLAACGVPVSLLGDGDGTLLRESRRSFLHDTVQPLARIVAQTLGEALDTPDLALNFDRLMASDLAGRARAFGSMVQGGMDPARAAALSGLVASDD